MARFQAMTNPVLERQLEDLREEMGLASSQKAELLRELASMAAWLVSQARAGRTIEARGASGTEVFQHPAFEASGGTMTRVTLDDAAADRLLALLDDDAPLSDELRQTLSRLSDPEPSKPTLSWRDA